MRLRNLGIAFALTLGVTVTASAASLGQIGIFYDQVGWIAADAAKREGDAVIANTKVSSIKVYNMDDTATFVKNSTGDGDADVLILFGYLPETVYTPGNAQKDDSLIEKFIYDGNVVLNTADYIFYVTLGGGANGDAGLKTITNTNLDLWTDNNAIVPTADGAKYTPSLKGFTSHRSLKKAQVDAEADWEFAVILGEGPLGVDPAILKNKTNGALVGIVMQYPQDDLPRGAVISELLNNYLPTVYNTTAVAPAGKLPIAWAQLKAE
jgi:hypothetical protein